MGNNSKRGVTVINEERKKLAIFYQKPLYENANNKCIKILIKNDIKDGFWYLDQCLQFGQMEGYSLNVYYECEDTKSPEKQFNEYIGDRPALKRFVYFKYGGEENKPAEWDTSTYGASYYGRVCFIKKVEEEIKFSYIFSHDCRDDKAIVINPDEIYLSNELYKNLDRMALNVHLAYSDRINDIPEMERFKEECEGYNYKSSLRNAISIKYKLKSMEIESLDVGLENDVLKKAANDFAEKKDKDENLKNRYAALEHRRWLMEKATDGWTAPLDNNQKINYEECLEMIAETGKPHLDGGKGNKKHICLVKSTTDDPLNAEGFNWDNDSTDGLDELDQISVKLFQELSKEKKGLGAAIEAGLEKVPPINDEFRKAKKDLSNAYDWYCYCVKNILDSNRSYSKRYESYKEKLNKEIHKKDDKTFAISMPEQFKKLIEEIDGSVKKYIAYNEKIDYKKYDEILFDKIPFILTYSSKKHLIMSFEDGRAHFGETCAVFKNVASAALLNPQKITYLINKKEHDDNLIENKKKAIENFCKTHNLQAGKSISYKAYNSMEDFKKEIESIEKSEDTYFDLTTKLFNSPWENHNAIDFVRGEFKCFITDLDKCELNPIDTDKEELSCDELKYIQTSPCISVNDMFSLSDADIKIQATNCDSYVNSYKELWEICTGVKKTIGYGSPNGERCNTWSTFIKKTNRPELSTQKKVEPGIFNEKTQLLNDLCDKGVMCANGDEYEYSSYFMKYMLLNSKIEKNAIEKKFVRENMSHELKMIIEKNKNIWNELIEALKKCEAKSKKYPFFIYKADSNIYNETKTMIGELEKGGFIFNREYNDDIRIVCFYLKPEYSPIFKNEGNILELWTYYKVLDGGYFDDVACSCKVTWGGENGQPSLSNEFDLICVKGFRSLIAECKLTKKLAKMNKSDSQNFYHKLLSLTQQFGISPHKAIIATIHDDPEKESEVRIVRGEQMNIPTYSGEDIGLIGEKLKGQIENDS